MAEEKRTETRTGTRFSYQTIETALGNVGKVPPQAVEFEQAVLGALMLDRDAITNVVNTLQPDMFYKEQHQEIYRAAKMLFQENEPMPDESGYSELLERIRKLVNDEKLFLYPNLKVSDLAARLYTNRSYIF